MMDGGAKDLPLAELTTFTKQRMKRKKTTKIKEPVAAVRKSTRPRKQTQRVLESADSQNEVTCNPPKKQRTNPRRLNKIDYCRNGQPFMCSACESQVINNSVAKARIKLEKFPIEKERDGKLLQLCVKCAAALNNLATKGPTQEEREEFEEEGRQFGEHWAKLLGDSDASRLYCAYVQSSKCGCIQSYITGTLVAKKRKSSYSVTDSEGATPPVVRTVGTSSSAGEPKVKDGAGENIQPPAVPQPPDGVSGPLSEADQMERARYLLSLLKESISKKKSHKKRKHQSQKPKPCSEEQLALQKKSLDTFILTNRAKLKSQGFCDRGCKKVLCYSNNFLHKKSARSEPRLQRTKGGIGQGRVPDLCVLPKFKCCDKECSKVASKHPDKVAQWRLSAQKSQKDMWSVIGQMLGTTTDDHGSKVCSKFIVAVTGCCQTTVNRVNFQKLLTKVDAGKPEHGMKSHWKRQRQDSRSYDASSTGTTNTTSPVGTISGPAGIHTADSARPLNPASSAGPLNPTASAQVSAVLKTSSLAVSLGSQSGPSTLNNQSAAPQWSTVATASGYASSIAGLLSAPRVTTCRTLSGVGQDTLQIGGLPKFVSLAVNEMSGAPPSTCQANLNAPGSTRVRPCQEHPGVGAPPSTGQATMNAPGSTRVRPCQEHPAEDIDQKMERLKEEISQKCLNLDNPEAIKSLQDLVNELAQTQRAREQQRLLQGPGSCSPLGNCVSASSGRWTTPETSGHTQVHSKVPLMIPAESASTTVLSSCHKGKDAVTVVTSSREVHPGRAPRGSAGEAPTRAVTNIPVPGEMAVLSSNINSIPLPQICKKFVQIAPKSAGFFGGSHVFRQLSEGVVPRQLPEGVVPRLVVKPSELLETSELGAFQIITTPQFVSSHQVISTPQLVASTQGVDTPQPVHTSQLISSSKLTTASATSCTFPSLSTMNAQPAAGQALTSPNDNSGRNLYTLPNFHAIPQSLTEQPDWVPEHHKPDNAAVSRSEPGLSFSTFISRNFNSHQGEAPLQYGNPQTKSIATPDVHRQQSVPAHSQSTTQGSQFGNGDMFVSNCNLITSSNSKENFPQAQTMRTIPFGQQSTELSLDSGQYVLNSDSVVSTHLNHLDFPSSSSINSFSDHQTLSSVPPEYQQSKLQRDHNFQLNSCDQQNHQTYAFSQNKFVTCSQVMQRTSTSLQDGLSGVEMPPTCSSESLPFDALAGSPVKDNSVLSFCTTASETPATSDHLPTWLCPSGALSSGAASSGLAPGAPHPQPTTLPSLLCKMLMENSTTLSVTDLNPAKAHTACGPTVSSAPQGLTQDSLGFSPSISTSGEEIPPASVSKCNPSHSLAANVGPVADDQSHLNQVSCSVIQSTNTTMAFALNQGETLRQCHVKVGKVSRTRDPPQVGIVNPYISGATTSTPATFANSNVPQSSFARVSSTALATDHVNVTLEPIPLVNCGETNISRAAFNLQNDMEPMEQPHLTSVLLDSNSLSPSALAFLSQQCHHLGSSQLNPVNTGQLSQQANQLSTSHLGQLSQHTVQLNASNLGQLPKQPNQLSASNVGQLLQQTNQLKTSNLSQLSQQTNHLNASNQGQLSQQTNQLDLNNPGWVSHHTSQLSLPAILGNPNIAMLSSDNSVRLSQNHPSSLLENPPPNVNLIPQGIHMVLDTCASNSNTKQLFVLPSGPNISTGGAAYYSICPLTQNVMVTPVSFAAESQFLIQQGNQVLVNVCPSSCSSSMPSTSSSQGNISVLSAPFGSSPSAVLQAATVQSPPTQDIASLAPLAARQPARSSENGLGEAGNFLQSNSFIPISQCSTTGLMGTSVGSNAVVGDGAELLRQARNSLPVKDRLGNMQLGSRVTETNRSPIADGNQSGTGSQLVEVNSTQVLRVTSSKAGSNSAESTTGRVVTLRHQEVQFENQISGVTHSGMTSVLSSDQRAVDVKTLVLSKQAAVEERFTTHLRPAQGPVQTNPSQSDVVLKPLTASQNGKIFVSASVHRPPCTQAHQPLPSADKSIALTRQSTPSANQPPVSPHQRGAPALPPGALAHQLPALVRHQPTPLSDQPSLEAQPAISRPPVPSPQSAPAQSATPASPGNAKPKPLAPRHDSLQQSTSARSSTENARSLPNKFLMPLKVLDVEELCRLGIGQASTEQSSGGSHSVAPGPQVVSHGQPLNKSYNGVTPAAQSPAAQANVDAGWSSGAPVFQVGSASRQVLPVGIQDHGSRLQPVPHDSATPRRTPKLQTAPAQPVVSKPYPPSLTSSNQSGKTAKNDKFQPDSQNSALLSQLALIFQHPGNLLPGKETIFTIEGATNPLTLQTTHSREIHLNMQGGVQTLMIVNDQCPEMLGSTEDSNLTCGKTLISEDSPLNQLMPSDFMNSFQVTGRFGNTRADTPDVAHVQNHPTVTAATTATSVDKSDVPKVQFMPASGQYHVIQSQVQVNKQDIEVNYLRGKDVIDLTDDSPPNTPTASMGQYKPVVSESQLPLTNVKIVVRQNQVTSHVDTAAPAATGGHNALPQNTHQEVVVQQPLQAHQHHRNPQPQQDHLYQKQGEYHCSPGEKQETQRSLFSDKQEFKTIPQHEVSGSGQQSGSSFSGSLTELGTRISTTPIFFLSPQTGTSNSKDDSQLNSFQTLDDEMARQLLSSLISQANCPQLFMESRNAQTHDDQFSDLLLSGGPPQHSETQVSGTRKAPTSTDFPRVTISLNQEFNQSDQVVFSPPQTQSSQGTSGTELYFTHAEHMKLSKENVSSSSGSLPPQPASEQTSHLNFPQHSVSSLTHNKNSNNAPSLSSFQLPQMSTSLLMPSNSLNGTSFPMASPVNAVGSSNSLMGMSFPMASPVNAVGSSTAVSFTRATNTPKGAVGPPNITVLSPSKPIAGQLPRARSESNSASAVFTVVSQANATANSKNLLSDNRGSSDTGLNRNLMRSNSSTCTQFNISSSSIVSTNSTNVSRHQETVSQAVPLVTPQAVLPSSTKTKEAFVKLTEAQARQPAKPKKRPATISELLKLQNHPVMGTYVFKGPRPTSEQNENPAVGQGLNIEVKNLQLISRSSSNPDRISSAPGLPCDPPGIKVLQPNTASLSSEASSKHMPQQNLVDAGPTTMLTLPPVLQLPLGQPPVTFTISRPVTEAHTALPKLMIAPSATNALTNSVTAQAQSGQKMQLKAPGVVFTEACSNSFMPEKSPQVLRLQSSSSADSSIQKKETLSSEPKMRLINHTQVSSAPTSLNSNSTVSYFGQKNFTAVGQRSGSTVNSEKLSLRPSSSFNSEEGLPDNQIHKFKLTGHQLNEAKFGKNSTGQSKTFLSFGQKFSSASPSLSGAGHRGEQGALLSESKLCSNNSQLLQLIKPKCPVPSTSSASELPASPQGNPDLILKFPSRKDPADSSRLSMAVAKDGQISSTSSYHSRHQPSLREQSPGAYGSGVFPVTSSSHEQIQGVDGSLSSNRIQKNPLLANILFENKTLIPSESGPPAVKKMKQGGCLEDAFQKSETTLRNYTAAFVETNGQTDSSLMNGSQAENQKSGFCYAQGEESGDVDHGTANLTGTTTRASKEDQFSENYGDLNECPMTASSQPQVYQSAVRNSQKISVFASTHNSHHPSLARSSSRGEAENLKTESAPSGRIDKVINDIYNFHEEEDSSPPPTLASSKTQSAYQLLSTQADGSQQCFTSPNTYDAGRSHIYTEDLANFTTVNKSDKHILEKSNTAQSHWDGVGSSDWRNPKRARGLRGNHKLNSKKVQFSDEVTDNGGHPLPPEGHAAGEAGKKQPLNYSRNVQGFNLSLTPPIDYQLSPERGEFLPHYLQNEQRPVEAVSPDGEVASTVPQHQELMSHALSLPESSCMVTEKHHPAVLKRSTFMEQGMTSEGLNSRESPSLKIKVKVGQSTQRGEGNDYSSHRYKPCPTAQEAHNEFKTTSFQNELSSFNILSTKGYSKLSSKRKTEMGNSSQWSPTSRPIDNNLKLMHNTETKDNCCAAGTQIVAESTSLQLNRWPEAASHGAENERRCLGSPQRFGLLEVDYETAQQMPSKKSARRPEATLSGHSTGPRDVDNQTAKGLGMAYGLSSPSPGFTQETYSENQNLNKEIQEKMDENKKLKKALALAIRDHNLVTQGGRENPEKFQASPAFDKADLAPHDLEDSRKLEEQRKRHASSSTGNAGILKHSPLPEAEMAKLGEVFAQRPWQTSQMAEQELQFSETGYRGNAHGASYPKLPAYVEGRSPPVVKGKDPLVSASSVGRPSSRPDLDSLQYENARRFQSLSSKNSTEADSLFLHIDHSGRHRNPSSSQRAQDSEPPPYDMSHRHRNPSASSVKSANQDTDWFFEPFNRSRNPSSSSWLTDFTSIRSRNPSGSSNRRSRPGSSNSDREFNLTNIDEFSFFLTDLGRTRSRNSSGESIEGHIWQSK